MDDRNRTFFYMGLGGREEGEDFRGEFTGEIEGGGNGEEFKCEGGFKGVGAIEIFAELVGDEKEDIGGGVEGEGGGQIGDFLVAEARGAEKLHHREGGERHVDGVEGGEVSEFLEGDGFRCSVRRPKLSPDLIEGFRDCLRWRGGEERGSEGFDQIVQRPLEEGPHDRR